MQNNRVVVLGGDGFCGWPTSLFLSESGYNVTIIDDLSRRDIDTELGVQPLTPIAPIGDRLDAWKEVSDNRIKFKRLNVAKNYVGLREIIKKIDPVAMVHFAELRCAPYSMKSADHKRWNVENNSAATNNLLNVMIDVCPEAHLVHLGTAGVYGYNTGGWSLPEGYINIKAFNELELEDGWEVLYPADPGSVYHLTKCIDALLFQFYCKNDRLCITDLHQGIVWGTQTEQTKKHEHLINRFDYDGDWGTVLNRFLMQSVVGVPLTVHGTGMQRRAFIHITDTIKCIKAAIESPPKTGDKVRIVNQSAEERTVAELAEIVQKIAGGEIGQCHNPRLEKESNHLAIDRSTFKSFIDKPVILEEELLTEVCEIAHKYKDRCDRRKIVSHTPWRKGMETGYKS